MKNDEISISREVLEGELNRTLLGYDGAALQLQGFGFDPDLPYPDNKVKKTFEMHSLISQNV